MLNRGRDCEPKIELSMNQNTSEYTLSENFWQLSVIDKNEGIASYDVYTSDTNVFEENTFRYAIFIVMLHKNKIMNLKNHSI